MMPLMLRRHFTMLAASDAAATPPPPLSPCHYAFAIAVTRLRLIS